MFKFLIISATLFPVSLSAQCSSTLVSSGTYNSAQAGAPPQYAEYVVYLPQPLSCYNGQMILFAHGYVPQGSPADAWKSQLTLADGTNLPTLVNAQGFGFAASGFSKQGLAILQGIQDTKALTNVIQGLPFPVYRYFVTGASEGGLIAAKAVESDSTYKGGLAVCGPLGSFQQELDYVGDARVLFDYFFPGVLTSAGGSAVNIPINLIANWTTVYEPAVRKAVNSNPLATLQYLITANIPIGLSLSNAADAITEVLSYNVIATDDAYITLGGNPYDNIGRIYHGSFDDARLNTMVARFPADPTALGNLPSYETTGLLHDPLVTLHTLADPLVPYTQEILYAGKVHAEHSSAELAQIPVLSYGHCNVSGNDAKNALLLLLLKAGL